MQTQIKIEQCEKPYCVIHTSLETDSIKEIAQKISMMDESGKSTAVSGWDGDYCIQIKQNERQCFPIFLHDAQSFRTVIGTKHFIFRAQDVGEYFPINKLIIDNASVK